MPNYNYKCSECGSIHEFVANMDQETLGVCCPACGDGDDSSHFVRVFSPPTNFTLKGSGWAKDGYSKPKKEEGNGK